MKLFVINFKEELNVTPFSYMHNIGVLESSAHPEK